MFLSQQNADHLYKLGRIRNPINVGNSLPAGMTMPGVPMASPAAGQTRNSSLTLDQARQMAAGAPGGGYAGRSGGFQNLQAITSAGGGPAPNPSGVWRPNALGNPPVAYPALNAVTGGGGGGGGIRGSFTYVPVEQALGPGAYMPGNNAKWKKDISDSFNSFQGAVNQGNKPAEEYWRDRAALQRASGSMGAKALADAFNAKYGGGGGGGSFANAQNAANQANEARYQDILGGYQQRYERNLANLQGAGQQEAADINRRYDERAANIRSDLIARGMGNSTTVDTMLAGNERERTNDLGRLQERLRNQQLAVDTGLTGDTLQFMERRNDVGPDLNMLARLASGVGAASVGGQGVEMLSPSEVGFQNPLAMLARQGGYQGGGRGYETSEERNRRRGTGTFGRAHQQARAFNDAADAWNPQFVV